MKPKPRVCIVSPALAQLNNGNWQTAARWQKFLKPMAHADITLEWRGEPADAMIALHARRSAPSVVRFREAQPEPPIALVMTGTDLYGDLAHDSIAQHALQCASHVVVLQALGISRLPPAVRTRARVIVQSASRLMRSDVAFNRFDLVAVGHLRDEKDPLTLMKAARLLPATSPIGVVHIGRALDAALGAEAQRTQQVCTHYRWLGELPHTAARRWIARARALVHVSRTEGGANVVIEAVRSGAPVLASRIDGNVGLLGSDYDGYFPVGDAAALALLMQRFAEEPSFAAILRSQCALREPLFAPAAETAAVRTLVDDMLGKPRQAPASTG